MFKSKEEQKIISLIKLLINSNIKERKEAYVALKKSESKLVPPLLVQSLKAPSPLIRRCSADILGERREKEAVQPLIEKLNDDDIGVILSAIIALGEIGDKRATMPVCRMLKDESPFFYFIRLNAANTLAKIRDPNSVLSLVEIIKEDDPIFMRSAVETLLTIDPESVVSPLIEILNDDKSLCKDQAAEFLGLLEEKRALNPLLKAVEDEDMEVKICALQALEKIGNEGCLIKLTKMHEETNNKTFRESLKNVISKICNKLDLQKNISKDLMKK